MNKLLQLSGNLKKQSYICICLGEAHLKMIIIIINKEINLRYRLSRKNSLLFLIESSTVQFHYFHFYALLYDKRKSYVLSPSTSFNNFETEGIVMRIFL